jgi:hypothetical protein
MTPELDVVTDPSFLAELDTREMDELRAVRSRCQSLENSLSYVRRLIQGRVDIVGGELQRRREGGDAGDTSELIGRLPDILSEGTRSAGGPGSVRPPHSLAPDPEVTAKLEVMLDAVIAADDLGNVSEIDEAALMSGLVRLNELEDEVSDHRRRLHRVIDTVQAEVTRRYTTGEATVDELLSS